MTVNRKKLIRKFLSKLQDNKCFYCNKELPKPGRYTNRRTIDHIRPKSIRGTNCITNLVLSCERCNNSKASNDVDYFIRNNTKVKYRKIVRQKLKKRAANADQIKSDFDLFLQMNQKKELQR